MPRVPLPQVAQDPSRTPASPGSQYSARVLPMPDSGLNEQAMRSGQAGLNAGLGFMAEAQKNIDEGAVKDRAGLLADSYRRILQDPEKGGYLNQKGYNAVTSRDGTLQSLGSARKALEATLENSRQRDAFAQVANAATLQAESHIDQHYNREALVFNLSRTSSLATARQNDWISNGSEESKGAMVGQITEASRMLGDPDETRAEKILDALSKGHAARIMTALKTDSIGAVKMFNAARAAKELDPNTEQQLQERLTIKSNSDLSQRLADVLTTPRGVIPPNLSSFSDNFHAQNDLQLEADDNAVAEVNRRFNLPDGDPQKISLEMRDETHKRIEAGVKQRLDGHKNQAESALQDGLRWLNENPNESFVALKSYNPELWQRGLAYDLTDKWAEYAKKRNFTTDPRQEAEFRAKSQSELELEDYQSWRLEHVQDFDPATLDVLSEKILIAQGRGNSSAQAASNQLVDDAINQSLYAVGIVDLTPTNNASAVTKTAKTIAQSQFQQRQIDTYRANARRLIAEDSRLPQGQRQGYVKILKAMEAAPKTNDGVNAWALSPQDKRNPANAEVVTNITDKNNKVPLEKLNISDTSIKDMRESLEQAELEYTTQDAVNMIMLGREANEKALTNDAVSYIQTNMPNEVVTENNKTFFSLLAVATVTGLPEATIKAQLGRGDKPPEYKRLEGNSSSPGYSKESLKVLLTINKDKPLDNPSTKFDTPKDLDARQDEVLTNRFNEGFRKVPVVEVAVQNPDGTTKKVRMVSMRSVAKMELADKLRSINTGSETVPIEKLQNSLDDQLRDRGVFGEFQGGLTLAAVVAETGLSEKEVVSKIGHPKLPGVGPASSREEARIMTLYTAGQLKSLDEQTSKVSNLSRDELVPVEEVLAAFIYLAKNPKPAAGQPWTRAPAISERRPVWMAAPKDKPHRNSVKPKMGGF